MGRPRNPQKDPQPVVQARYRERLATKMLAERTQSELLRELLSLLREHPEALVSFQVPEMTGNDTTDARRLVEAIRAAKIAAGISGEENRVIDTRHRRRHRVG